MEEQISYKLLAALLTKAKRYYTNSFGCLVKMYGKQVRKGIDLCIASVSNEKLYMPENCRIWKSESCLFKGKIDSEEVTTIINENSVCCAEITDTKSMEFGIHGKLYCLRPDRCFSRCSTCKACTLQEERVEVISEKLTSIWNSKFSLASKKVHRALKAKGRKRGG